MKDKLKRARLDAGLTQKELAEKIGVSRQAVSSWECGDRTPSTEYVYMYHKVLNLKKDYFCELTGTDFVMGKCFDISRLNSNGLKKLYSFYEELLTDDENLKR